MQIQYHFNYINEMGIECPFEAALVYVNATTESANRRFNQITKLYHINDYAAASDFGCSKGNFSLVKKGQYGIEHGEDHRYATAPYRAMQFKRFIYLYDLSKVIELKQFSDKAFLSTKQIATQMFAFYNLRPNFVENAHEINAHTEQDMLKLLHDWINLELEFNQRDVIDQLLMKAVHNPLTLMNFEPSIPKFKHHSYTTTQLPFRFQFNKGKTFDGLITYLAAADNCKGWKPEQWAQYFVVRFNLDFVIQHQIDELKPYATVQGVGIVDADEVNQYLPKIRSSSIAAMNSASHMTDDRGFVPAAPRRKRQPRKRSAEENENNNIINYDNNNNNSNESNKKPKLDTTHTMFSDISSINQEMEMDITYDAPSKIAEHFAVPQPVNINNHNQNKNQKRQTQFLPTQFLNSSRRPLPTPQQLYSAFQITQNSC